MDGRHSRTEHHSWACACVPLTMNSLEGPWDLSCPLDAMHMPVCAVATKASRRVSSLAGPCGVQDVPGTVAESLGSEGSAGTGWGSGLWRDPEQRCFGVVAWQVSHRMRGGDYRDPSGGCWGGGHEVMRPEAAGLGGNGEERRGLNETLGRPEGG